LVSALFDSDGTGGSEALAAVETALYKDVEGYTNRNWSQEGIYIDAAFKQDPEQIAKVLGIDPATAYILS